MENFLIWPVILCGLNAVENLVFQHFTECENNRNFFTQSQPKRTLLFEGDPRNKSKRGFYTYIQGLNCPLGEFIFECSVQFLADPRLLRKMRGRFSEHPSQWMSHKPHKLRKNDDFLLWSVVVLRIGSRSIFMACCHFHFHCIYGFYILSTLNSIHCTVCDSCESNC